MRNEKLFDILFNDVEWRQYNQHTVDQQYGNDGNDQWTNGIPATNRKIPKMKELSSWNHLNLSGIYSTWHTNHIERRWKEWIQLSRSWPIARNILGSSKEANVPERCCACYAFSPDVPSLCSFRLILSRLCEYISDVTPTGKESRNSMWPGSQLIESVSQTTSPNHAEQFFEQVLCKNRGVLEQTRKVQTESAKSNWSCNGNNGNV